MTESELFVIRSVAETENARHFSLPLDRTPRRVRSKMTDTKSENEAEVSHNDAQEEKPRLDVTA